MSLYNNMNDWTLATSSAIIQGFKYVWKEHKVALGTTFICLSIIKICQVAKKRKLRHSWDSVGENVIVLHGLPRGMTVPNLSPFVLKLETYLRMAGLKYVHDCEIPFGPKGKTPWITLNGKDYADSQLIMEFLGVTFNKNFSTGLNVEQKAVARAMLIMVDEHMFWGVARWRFCIDPELSLLRLMGISWLVRFTVFPVIRQKMQNVLWAQGIGRHSEEEINGMIKKDLTALSLYLGNKPFMMGDAPCEVDCAVFGIVAQCLWATPGSPFTSLVQGEYRNLLDYAIRMKDRFWPDWDKCLLSSC